MDNRALVFNDAGAAVAYFYNNSSISSDGELKSELGDGVWGAPQAASAQEASGSSYVATPAGDAIDVERANPRAGEPALPAVQRPRCEGY